MRRRRRGVGGALALAAAMAGLAGSALGGRVFHYDPLRIVSFELPREWQRAPQVGYPGVLMEATAADGARIVLAGQRVALGTSPLMMAADARAALIKQGFIDPRVSAVTGPGGDERARLDAGSDGGRQALRQLYVVDGDVAVVVTVVASASKQARPMREVEAAVEALEFARPEVGASTAATRTGDADGGVRPRGDGGGDGDGGARSWSGE